MSQALKNSDTRDALAALAAAALTLALLGYRRVPVMFVLLLFGAAIGNWRQPALMAQVMAVPVALRLPAWQLSGIEETAACCTTRPARL